MNRPSDEPGTPRRAGDVPDDRRVPLSDRLAPDHPAYRLILAAHDAATEAGAERYTDPATGYGVFTAQALWDRGTCCATGCRHCPYADGVRG